MSRAAFRRRSRWAADMPRRATRVRVRSIASARSDPTSARVARLPRPALRPRGPARSRAPLPPRRGSGARMPRTRDREGRRHRRRPRPPPPRTTTASSLPSRSGRRHQTEARTRREAGLHARCPRVEPEHHVAVLDPSRRSRVRSERSRTCGRPGRGSGVLRCHAEEHHEVGRRRVTSIVEAMRGCEPRPRHAQVAFARAFMILTKADHAARLLDRQGFGRVVRRAEQQSREQPTDGEPFAGPEPEGRSPSVVTAVGTRRPGWIGIVRSRAPLPAPARAARSSAWSGWRPAEPARAPSRTEPVRVSRSMRIAAEASTFGTGIGSAGVDRWETNGDGEPLGGTGVGGGPTAGRARSMRENWVSRTRRGRRRPRPWRRAVSRAVEVVAQVGAEQGLLELPRRARRGSPGVWAAVRRASGFFCRSVGATIWSKNEDSRSAKCLYIVRCLASIAVPEEVLHDREDDEVVTVVVAGAFGTVGAR